MRNLLNLLKDSTDRSLTVRVLVAAARGSVLGAAAMAWGYCTHPHDRNDLTLGWIVGAGAALGPVVSLVLMATKRWRTGLIGTYASSIVAGVVTWLAVGAVLAIRDPASAREALGICAFFGLCTGLGLGVYVRQWQDPT